MPGRARGAGTGCSTVVSARIGHWQGRRARYRGARKNLLDLRRVAVVHNLHIIARQLDDSNHQLAA